jgi:hypothetical protein
MHRVVPDVCVIAGSQDELKERDHGHVPRDLTVGPVEYTRALAVVEDPLGLVEVLRDQPLAGAGEVLRTSTTVDVSPPARVPVGDDP